MANIQDKLKFVGLTDNEALVYSTLLEIGARPAGTISRKTGLHRRVVYDITDRLIKKGLIGYIVENGKKILMRNRGVKQAGFAVLRGVRMPAILVETSYLSNEADENNFKNPEFKDKMVRGFLEAIKKLAAKMDKRRDENK